MKKILISFCVCILFFTVTAQAKSEKIVDNAGLLTSNQASVLEADMQRLIDTYQTDIVILTVPSLDGKSAQSYADDYFDNNGYGIDIDHSGVLFLISIEYSDWAISTCGSTISALSDYDIDLAMDAVIPYLSDGDYYTAFQTYLDELEYHLADYKESNTLTLSKILFRLLWAVAIGAAVAGIVLLIMRSSMNTSKLQHGAENYIKDNSFDLIRCHDLYLYSHTSKVRRNTDSGRSSKHRSSSGRSHGGRSGKF